MGGNQTSGPDGGGRMIEGINVTPLVDIMLVLLIIVMVSAKFTSTSAVPLDLPESSESDRVRTVFSVTVPAGDKLRVDGTVIERNELARKATVARKSDPDLRAVIQADGDVPHRRIMGVMDALREAGLTQVAFATVAEQTTGGGAQPEGNGRDSAAEREGQ